MVSKYCISSINSKTAVFRSKAASATAIKRFDKSTSKSPLSAAPTCGSISMPISKSPTFNFTAPTKLFKTAKKIRLLHFAPEKIFYDIFSNHQNIEYYPCDLYPETYRYHGNVPISKVDVTKIPFEDNYFDVVICNHVLEHVIEDQLAMSEIYRVLKKGGWSILQVPIDQDREVTFEDFSIISPKERLRVFGQKDHVRCYGTDYIERLKKASFIVSEDDFIKSFSKEDLFKYGLMDSELIYHCEK